MWKKATVLMTLLCFTLSGSLYARGSAKKTTPEGEAAEAVKLYNKGVDSMEKGDFAKAQERFTEALAKKEDFAEAHNNLGYALRKQGKAHYGEALEHYNRALELNPELAAAYQYRGVLYVLRGEEDKAKADHATLAELDRAMADELLQVIASGEEPKGNAGLAGKWADH
jgi:tetratricopeptide (TPR) repeat protein